MICIWSSLMPLPPHHHLLQYDPEWFTFLVPAYPGCPGKNPLNGCSSRSSIKCFMKSAVADFIAVWWIYITCLAAFLYYYPMQNIFLTRITGLHKKWAVGYFELERCQIFHAVM